MGPPCGAGAVPLRWAQMTEQHTQTHTRVRTRAHGFGVRERSKAKLWLVLLSRVVSLRLKSSSGLNVTFCMEFGKVAVICESSCCVCVCVCVTLHVSISSVLVNIFAWPAEVTVFVFKWENVHFAFLGLIFSVASEKRKQSLLYVILCLTPVNVFCLTFLCLCAGESEKWPIWGT